MSKKERDFYSRLRDNFWKLLVPFENYLKFEKSLEDNDPQKLYEVKED